MDRLTRRMCGGWGLVDGCELDTTEGMRRVVERLAAYENTGMTPVMDARMAAHKSAGKMMQNLQDLENFRLAQAEGRIAILSKGSKSFRPIVSDDPQDNLSTALNLFYVKDEWAWIRGGGPAPDYPDISLNDYIRLIAREHDLDIAHGDDDEISMEMAELLLDGTDTMEGIMATLYTAGWAFAELRERLKRYETTGKAPEELLHQLVTPFENDPFSMVWAAFRNLYPDKECKIYWDQHQEDEHEKEYGFTTFPDDGSAPQVFIYAEHPVSIQTETLGHELAHVAVGPEHEHDDVWEAAFDAIFEEYNRIGELMFGVHKGEDENG